MSISIYNSLSRQKEELKPLKPPRLNIYTCGVTVYDESHIGHARSLFTFDLMRRYLKSRGFKVRFCRNITDIDDKILKRANELKVNWTELVNRYILSYYADLKALGIGKGDCEPRATQNIGAMVKYIRQLIVKGYAYESGGDVYFDVRKFNSYGRLSGQSIDEMHKGVRIELSDLKKDPLDFALWKRSKEGEPAWKSPWGPGRPGWHIECSVMSRKFLKIDTLDIHAGGRDLIFPHHENEIAQAEALTGKPFAKYWIHHGLLTINGQKMAKSLGNFITIKDFIAKYGNADLLKLFFLGAHYSQPVDFTSVKMEEEKQALSRILIYLDKTKSIRRFGRGSLCQAEVNDNLVSKEEGQSSIRGVVERFAAAMDDDFNTPEALACIFELVNLGNKNISDPQFNAAARQAIFDMAKMLGLELKARKQREEISEVEVKVEVEKRNAARKNKDYALSDKIRKELEEKGVILEDSKDGSTTWRRKL